MTAIKLSDKYLALIRRFPLIPIRQRHQFNEAVALMKELTKPARLSVLTEDEANYLDVLTDLIAKYETINIKQLSEPMKPTEALRYLLEESGVSQSELARQTGIRQSHVSEFLSQNRALSKESIIKISRFFKVSPELLLVDG